MSEIRVFAACVTLGFVGSFGGAHLITDLLAPASREALAVTIALLGLVGRAGPL